MKSLRRIDAIGIDSRITMAVVWVIDIDHSWLFAIEVQGLVLAIQSVKYNNSEVLSFFLLTNQPYDLSALPVEQKMTLKQPYQCGLRRKGLCRLWSKPSIKPSYESQYQEKILILIFSFIEVLVQKIWRVKSSSNENVHN